MSYLTQSAISANYSMIQRVAQAVAQEASALDVEGSGDPDAWTYEHRRYWAASPGWDAAWESAIVSHPPTDGPELPYDPGTDEGVITDGMILSAVQALLVPVADL